MSRHALGRSPGSRAEAMLPGSAPSRADAQWPLPILLSPAVAGAAPELLVVGVLRTARRRRTGFPFQPLAGRARVTSGGAKSSRLGQRGFDPLPAGELV